MDILIKTVESRLKWNGTTVIYYISLNIAIWTILYGNKNYKCSKFLLYLECSHPLSNGSLNRILYQMVHW